MKAQSGLVKIGLALVSLSGSLVGCASAEITKKTFSPQPGGVVKYANGYMVAEKSRAKALELMNSTCFNKGYRVLSESNGTELGAIRSSVVNGQTQISQSESKFVYLEFACNP